MPRPNSDAIPLFPFNKAVLDGISVDLAELRMLLQTLAGLASEGEPEEVHPFHALVTFVRCIETRLDAELDRDDGGRS